MVAVSQVPTEVTAPSVTAVYDGRSQNRITLQCRENSICERGQFWVLRPGFSDRESLNMVTNTFQNLQNPERTVFEISQDLEGTYSCILKGRRSSTTLRLVGELLRMNKSLI